MNEIDNNYQQRYFVTELNSHIMSHRSKYLHIYFNPLLFFQPYFHHSLSFSRLIIAFHSSHSDERMLPSMKTKVSPHVVVDTALLGRERKKARAREIPRKRRRRMVEEKTIVPTELGRSASSVIRSSTVLARVNEQGWTLTRIGWRRAMGRG